MNRLNATLILLLLTFNSLCQVRKEAYPSQQEQIYNKKQNYKEFQPENISIVKRITYHHIRLRSADTHNKFVTVWERTNYLKYYDSLEQICRTNLWEVIGTPKERHLDWDVGRFLKYYDSLERLGVLKSSEDPRHKVAEKKYEQCVDSVRNLIHHYAIAGIESDRILRYDSFGAKQILVYKEFRMTDLEPAYWVAISVDNAKSWNKYFTGLIENNFYYVKPNPKIGLFKNDSTIQLEVALVRQMEEWARPGPVSENMYKLVEDNLIVELNLNGLVADTDHDGLTDILEKRLFINPFSKDTDCDGFEDAIDSNPRFKSTKTKYSNLIVSLLEASSLDSTFIPFEHFELKKSNKRDTSTYFIISDDINILNLGGTTDRYIILKAKELSQYKNQNQGGLRQIVISPFFEVDNMPGAKKVNISYGFAGYSYLIIERKNGWFIKIISSWIT